MRTDKETPERKKLRPRGAPANAAQQRRQAQDVAEMVARISRSVAGTPRARPLVNFSSDHPPRAARKSLSR
jgi:hypothetical protein